MKAGAKVHMVPIFETLVHIGIQLFFSTVSLGLWLRLLPPKFQIYGTPLYHGLKLETWGAFH